MIIALLVCFWIPPSLLAQEKQTLTLEQSVNIALEKNPALKMAEKEVAKAKAAVWESYSTILPQLDASASLQHAWSIQQNTMPNFLKPMLLPLANLFPQVNQMPDYVQLSFGLENTFMYGATLTQPLYLGGAGLAGIQIAYSVKAAAEQNLAAQKQDLIFQTTNAFYAALLAKELVSVQEEALAQAQANLDLVRKKFDVGTASGFDKMRAEVEVSNLNPEVITARNGLQSALTLLRNVLGLPRETEIELEGELSYAEDALGSMSLLEVQNAALKNRPESRAMSEQKHIARKGITIARSNFLPKLVFQTDYSYLAMKNDLKISQKDFSKGFTSAIALQIPLFHGFRSAQGYQKAQLDYKITIDTEKQVYDGIAAESEIAYNKFQESRQKYVSAKESVNLAKEALRLANMMYEEGASTQLDVLISQLALNRAKLNYVSSLYEYQMSRYQLRKAIGNLTGVL